jgi:hypothetical protein
MRKRKTSQLHDAESGDAYPFQGVALLPGHLVHLAEEFFKEGEPMERQWLSEDAPRIHERRGGLPGRADAGGQAKKARVSLLKRGWTEACYGTIRRRGGIASIPPAEDPPADEARSSPAAATEGGDAEVALEEGGGEDGGTAVERGGVEDVECPGEGDGVVYAYTFPTCRDMAQLREKT